jgi:hypothetical protein
MFTEVEQSDVRVRMTDERLALLCIAALTNTGKFVSNYASHCFG